MPRPPDPRRDELSQPSNPSTASGPLGSRPVAGEPFPGEAPGGEEVPAVDWPLLWRARLRRRVHDGDRARWWTLWTALAGLFATGFTITVLAVSLPDIARDLHSTETTLTWVVTGPLLTLALGMPLFGKLGDVHGHRRVYLVGFAAFTVLTLVTAFAWNAPALIVLRVVGALAGAATGPTSMALIMGAFPAEDRVKAMGWWSLVGAGAPVIGLVAGGPIVDAFGWRWLFVAQVPISALALLLGAMVLRETPRRPHETLDVAGAVFLAVATLCGLLAISRGAAWGWTAPVVVALLAVTPVSLALFVRAERRAPHPLLPLDLFGRPNVTPSLIAQFASNFAYMGGFIITPLLVQDVFGFSVTGTSLAMLVRPLTFSLSSPASGYLAVRVGERRASVVGTALVVASMSVFAVAANASLLPLVFVAMFLSGLGLGASQPSLISSVANAVDARDLGVANAAQTMITQIGVVVGIQVLSTVHDAATFSAAYLAGAVVACLGVVGAAFVRSARRAEAVQVAPAA